VPIGRGCGRTDPFRQDRGRIKALNYRRREASPVRGGELNGLKLMQRAAAMFGGAAPGQWEGLTTGHPALAATIAERAHRRAHDALDGTVDLLGQEPSTGIAIRARPTASRRLSMPT
jgi:hypothetical protein